VDSIAVFFSCKSHSPGYPSRHILSQSPSLKIGMVVAGRASGVKNILGCMAGLTLAALLSSVWLLQAS